MAWKAITWSRGRLLRAMLLTPVAYVLAACTGQNERTSTRDAGTQAEATAGSAASASPAGSARSAPVQPTLTQVLQPTPDCADADDPTPPQTEGPFFTRNSPERTSLLEPGMTGTRLMITGYVLTTTCRPVPGALLDFWQCDDAGVYDNHGYRLRGHQFADDEGRYQLETIVPAIYPGRTRHIHVKVQAPNEPVLTTQLYFPNEPGNARDRIFRPECVMAVQDTANGKEATFNFVLNLR